MNRAAALAIAAMLACLPATAQEAGPEPTKGPALENIQIGLSTDQVAITSDFAGADLTIFGSVDNADPLLSRQNRYDVIAVLEGPARPVVVWRKDRFLGMWINAESETFVNVPASYSVATTKVFQDITDAGSYKRLSLGADNLYLQPLDRDDNAATIEEFTAALRQQKEISGLYSERVGGVQFLSQNLFRATLTLAPNVPVGTHKARAFLFRNGVFIKETSAQLAILKAGFEQSIFLAAHEYSLLYGLFAVALAMLTGWVGRVVFRRD